MSIYAFEFKEFAISEDGIHLLRSGFNYKTIPFQDLSKVIMKRGIEINNWLFTLILGIALCSFAFLQTVFVWKNFHDPKVYTIYIESIVLPVIPAFVGIYCLYVSFKKGPILVLHSNHLKKKLSLKDVIKKNELTAVKLYFKEKIATKISIEGGI